MPPFPLEQGKSVLDRLDTHMPRKTVASMAPPPNHVGSTNSRHDHNANRRALMSYERMTDAEREANERRKEENRKQEVLDAAAVGTMIPRIRQHVNVPVGVGDTSVDLMQLARGG